VSFAAAIAAATEAQPQARPDKVAGRTLLCDGDGLAYYCAGNDDTSSGMARRNLETKIESAMRASGADKVVILATSAASHKGHRYAIASVKAYQGKRDHGRRPKNWQFMRELIERDPRTTVTDTLEADDLFHINSVRLGDENVALLTQDKDLRMVPGWHLNWDSHALVRVRPDTWEFEVDGKVFGRKFFWLQMLMGDTADNVPGLPKCWLDNKQQQCGEARASRLLAGAANEQEAADIVANQYLRYYEGQAPTHFMEQACLLWMRRSDRLFDCILPGGPLQSMPEEAVRKAIADIKGRVTDL
jgi:hypothetical protein